MFRRLLVIDDSMLVRELARAILGASGEWTIDVAAGGEEGVACAIASPPDAILLDVEMDGMDGIETLRRFRSLDPTREIPVAFLTANDSEQDQLKLDALGPTAVICKPVDPVSFADRVAETFGW